MKPNPFFNSTVQAMLPFDAENNAFRLRQGEFEDYCLLRTFFDWLTIAIEEAKRLGISLETFSRRINEGIAPNSLTSWHNYGLFVGILNWMHSAKE
jgi:hypothetical protein